jgi:hypothetical protein
MKIQLTWVAWESGQEIHELGVNLEVLLLWLLVFVLIVLESHIVDDLLQ